MGQARLRGTQEERTQTAAAANTERQRKAAIAEAEHNLAIAREWAAKSEEEREAALNAAKREAALYGDLSANFGHDAAGLVMACMSGQRIRRRA